MIGISHLKAAGLLVLTAAAQAPVAVVEDVTGGPSGIQFMDYVEPGQVIRLGAHDTIVLGYLKSCWHETITGGTVTVGTELSAIVGGDVARSKIACEGGKMMLTAELADKSAVMAFRPAPNRQSAAPSRPEFTLYGLSPVVEVKPGGTLVIERVDQPGERHELILSGMQLLHGKFLDLARAGVVLTAGGIYRATAGTRQMVFKIDPSAQSGESPIAGRLIRLQPAG
jgi:hypothetical protein